MGISIFIVMYISLKSAQNYFNERNDNCFQFEHIPKDNFIQQFNYYYYYQFRVDTSI